MGNLNLAIKHPKDGQEFWILDDEIGTVTACTPQRQEIAHTMFRVSGAMSEVLDALAFWGRGVTVLLDMPSEVRCRAVPASP